MENGLAILEDNKNGTLHEEGHMGDCIETLKKLVETGMNYPTPKLIVPKEYTPS